MINLISELDKRSFISNMLMHAMTAYAEKHSIKDFIKHFDLANSDLKSVDVKISVNGIEIDFEPFAHELEKSYGRAVRIAARKILNKYVYRDFEKIFQVMKQKLQELNISTDEDEDQEEDSNYAD